LCSRLWPKKEEEKEEGKQKRMIIGTVFFVFFRLSIFRPSHFFLVIETLIIYTHLDRPSRSIIFFFFVKIPPTYSWCKIEKKEHARTYQKAIRRRINKESKP
jgi:hypothetical protein